MIIYTVLLTESWRRTCKSYCYNIYVINISGIHKFWNIPSICFLHFKQILCQFGLRLYVSSKIEHILTCVPVLTPLVQAQMAS